MPGRLIALVLMAGLVGAPCVVLLAGTEGADAGRAPVKKQKLTRFSSCDSLTSYARRNALRTMTGGSPPGVGRGPAVGLVESGAPERADSVTGAPTAQAPAAGGTPGEDFSTTNVQEAGVDEPDIIKTDGSTVFAIAQGSLHAIDARNATPKLLGSLALRNGGGGQLLVHDNKALVVSSGGYAIPQPGRPVADFAPVPSGAVLEEIDISDPSKMRVIRSLEVDGALVTARLTGRTARVVLSSRPPIYDVPSAQGSASTRIRRAKSSGWVPRATLRRGRAGRGSKRALVSCRSVRRPYYYSGTGLSTVLTVDMAKGLPAVDSDSVMADSGTVYASKNNLYVSTQRWINPVNAPQRAPSGAETAIHRFSIADRETTSYRSSGLVSGLILNQFSMSEHEGRLRVASTQDPPWLGGTEAPGRSQSYVTVLDERDGRLAQVGRIGGLGKGERIFAVRFIEDAGFVVTFRQIDPLYAIDLSSPSRPRVAGELKIRGYSSYLHPVGNGLLLGVGQDATEQGQTVGTQLSLFDVSDLASPRRLQQLTVAQGSSSEAEFDHHAFLYWAPRRLAVLPLNVYGGAITPRQGAVAPRAQGFQGAIGFRVAPDAPITETGRVVHREDGFDAPIRRSLVIGDRLLTLSDARITASDLGSLAQQGTVALKSVS